MEVQQVKCKQAKQDGPPILDVAGAILQLGDEDIFKELLTEFEEQELDDVLLSLKNSMETMNLADVRQAAHQLLDSLGYLNAWRAHQAAASLKEVAEAGCRDSVLELYADLIVQCLELKREIYMYAVSHSCLKTKRHVHMQLLAESLEPPVPIAKFFKWIRKSSGHFNLVRTRSALPTPLPSFSEDPKGRHGDSYTRLPSQMMSESPVKRKSGDGATVAAHTRDDFPEKAHYSSPEERQASFPSLVARQHRARRQIQAKSRVQIESAGKNTGCGCQII